MSIFGSRTKTTVGTSVARAIDDKMLPDSLKSGAVQALVENSSDTVNYVMEEIATGLGVKMNAFYQYGKGKYTYGLPAGNSYSSVTGKDTVAAAVRADVGAIDSISYYKLGAANMMHVGWLLLVRDFAYDSTNNMLTVNGKRVYLSNMQPVVVESNFGELENGSMDIWGVVPSAGYSPDRKLTGGSALLDNPPPFIVDSGASSDYIKVSYCWEEDVTKVVEGVNVTTTEVKKATITLSIASVDMTATYFQVRFLQNGRAGYWMYRLNSGEKPTVEAIFDAPPTTAGSYFPWAYFRFDKKQTNGDKTTDAYRTTKRMLKTIGMDYDKIADGINENPDIKDVEQAMLVMAVPAKTENEVERRYLFDFFSNMYLSASANSGAANAIKLPDILKSFESVLNKQLNKTTIIIRDKRFKMALSFDTIVKHRVAGNIGKIGHHDSGTNINSDTKKVVNIFGSELSWMTQVPTHYYRRQITENIYEELLVTNLKMTYYIFGDYTATADENDDILLVPLDYAIVANYEMFAKEELYGRSLHYVFNSRVVTKLKWYQTGIFRALLIVVAIVIMVFNIAAGIKALAVAIAAGATATAIAYMVLTAIVKYILVTLAVRLFVKVVGVKIAFIAAIVAALYGMYQIYDAGSVAGAPWAKDLLALSSNISKAIGKSIASEFDALKADADAFEKYKDTQETLLDKAQDLLDGDLRINPMIIWGETPSDFYQRTVHSGNIGMVGIDAVSSFVQMSLTLPKLTDTLGESYV